MWQSLLWLVGRRFPNRTKVGMPTAMVNLKSEINDSVDLVLWEAIIGFLSTLRNDLQK